MSALGKITKKLLKLTLIGLLSLILLVVGLAAAIWFKPALVINNKTLAQVKPHIEKMGISWTAETLQLGARSLSFYEKSVEFDTKNFCVRYSAEQEPLCFDHLELNLSADLKGFALKTLHLNRLIVEAKPIHYAQVENKKPEPPKKTKSKTDFSWLDRIFLGEVKVSAPVIEFKAKDDTYTASALVLNQTDQGFQLKAQAVSKNKKTFKRAQIQSQSARVDVLRDLFLPVLLQAQAELPQNRNVQLKMQGKSFVKDNTLLVGEAQMKDPKTQIKLGFNIERKNTHIHVKTSGSIWPKTALRGPVRIEDCHLNAVLPPAGRKQVLIEKADLNCLFAISAKDVATDQSYIQLLPPRLDMKLIANVEANKSDDLVGALSLEVGPIVNSFTKGSLNANYNIDLSKDAPDSAVKIGGNIKIVDFKKFADLANAIGILIPAPINVLHGTASVAVDGAFDLKPMEGQLKVKLNTDLKSTDQDLDLNAEGNLKIVACQPPMANTLVDVELVTTQVKIRLPNIDYKNPPAVTADSRFVKRSELAPAKKAKSKSGCGFAYNLRFKNAPNAPILIVGPMLKTPVPLQITIKAQSDKPVAGNVRIQDYSAKLFRRDATVQNFYLDLDTKILDGRFRIDYAEYKIFINLSGTTQSVHVEFESDPPLDRQQVMSVLLFGKKLEGLDDDQSGSVNNVDAAAKDGALSLASLYLFASTPIESVGYNPHTNGLTAKVKVANGTTVNVGANDQGFTDVGVTRKLSTHWRIQTTLGDPTDTGEKSASTLLEWFNRF